jgi:dihydropteroate synthase
MQNQPTYKNVVNEVVTNLSKKIFLARQNGIMDIIIDPGFGFGKTLNHNYEILNNLEHFKELDCPILVGVSRKSMIYKPLEIEPNKALNGTTCIHTISILSGANILRVHDVKEAKEVVKLTNILKGNT